MSKKSSGNEVVAKIDRTSGGLRNCLFDEIDALRDGTSNPQRARAVSSLANTALKSVMVEVEYHKYVCDVSKNAQAAQLGSLQLSV